MIEEVLDLDVLADPCRTTEILAGQKPVWKSGTRHGYHRFALGLYQSREVPRGTAAVRAGASAREAHHRADDDEPFGLHGAATNFNRRDTLAVEMPSADGIGRVGSIAKPCRVFPTGGAELDLKQEKTLDELSVPAVEPTSGSHDAVLLADTSYSFRSRKPCLTFNFGSSDRSFGIGGIGGSFAFADLDAQVGYAYDMTKPGFEDLRRLALTSVA